MITQQDIAVFQGTCNDPSVLGPSISHPVNVFGAYKVTYFNAAKEYVEKMGGDWAKVHTGTLLSGYINDMHTYAPGPDGKLGYGGKCFPKDVNAFAKMTQGTAMGTLLAPLHDLNAHFRGAEERI